MDAAPPGSPAAFDLARFMPYRLLMVTNRLSQAYARRYQAEFGITIPESRVLNVTTRFGPLSSHEICERTAMTKSRVSAALGRLVAAGLIERETDPTDQRLLRLTTSRRGRALYARIVPVALEIERAVIADIGEAGRQELMRLLASMDDRIAGLETGRQDTDPRRHHRRNT